MCTLIYSYIYTRPMHACTVETDYALQSIHSLYNMHMQASPQYKCLMIYMICMHVHHMTWCGEGHWVIHYNSCISESRNSWSVCSVCVCSVCVQCVCVCMCSVCVCGSEYNHAMYIAVIIIVIIIIIVKK